MTATNRFISLSLFGQVSDQVAGSSVITEGASTAASDYVELRMLITKSDGTTATNLTIAQTLTALEQFKRFLIKQGRAVLGSVTNSLPLPGPAP